MRGASRALQIRERIALYDRATGALLLDQFRDEAGPTGLMTRAESGAGVAMEVLVKPIEIPIVPGLKRIAGRTSERTPAIRVAKPKLDQTIR